LLILMNLGN